MRGYRNTKIGTEVAHVTRDSHVTRTPLSRSKGQRSRSQGRRHIVAASRTACCCVWEKKKMISRVLQCEELLPHDASTLFGDSRTLKLYLPSLLLPLRALSSLTRWSSGHTVIDVDRCRLPSSVTTSFSCCTMSTAFRTVFV